MRDRAQAGLWFLESIDRVSRAIAGTHELEQMMNDVLDVVLDVFACDRAWLITPPKGDPPILMPTAERTRPEYPGGLASGVGLPAPEALRAMHERVLAAGEPLAFDEAQLVEAGLREALGVRAMLVTAIYPKEMESYAFGLHQCSRARSWTVDERDLLREIGLRVAVGLHALLLFRELRASEHRFRAFVDHATDALFLFDPTGHVIDVNQRACESLGYSREELLGTTPKFFDAQATSESLTAMRDRFDIQELFAFDTLHRRRDGSVFPVEVRMRTFWDGERRVVALARDITERKLAETQLRASEERFRRMIEHASDLISVTNRDGVFRFQSPAAKRMLGYEPEDMLGKVCFDYVHPDDVAKKRSALERAVADPGTPIRVDQRIRAADGKWRLFETILQSLPDQRGEGFIVLNSRDLTDARQLEEKLRQSQKMEAIGQLAGGVAHDFNNILAAIMMQTELSNVPNVPAEVVDNIAEIQVAAERAAELTRQLLMFSRRQPMQPRDVDLNDLVRSLGKMLHRIIGDSISILLELDPTPLVTRVDPGMIDQLLMNIAINSRDAMPTGGALVIQTRANGDQLVIRVEDTGIGIPPEILPHIFEPFFTTKEAGKGTGLGLATVFGIVQQHGGSIGITSKLGHGTTVEVTLPRTGAGTVGKVVERPAPRGGNELVLLVEDDAVLRNSTRRLLARAGYRVLVAGNGREALEVWEGLTEKPALLLTDLVMPGLSGHQVAAALRAWSPGIAILYTSGYSPETAGKTVELREGENFLQKPVASATLLETVRRSLDR